MKKLIISLFILTACSGDKAFLSADNKLKETKTDTSSEVQLIDSSHVEADLSNPFHLFKLKKGYSHEDPSSYRQAMEEEIRRYAKENSSILGSFIQDSELDIFPYYTSFHIQADKLDYDRFKKWISSVDDKVRIEACLSAQLFSSNQIEEVAQKYLYDSEIKVSLSCIFALGKSEKQVVIPYLVDFLKKAQEEKHPHLFQIQIFGLQALSRLMRPGFLDRDQITWLPQRQADFEIYKIFEKLSQSTDKGVSRWAILTAVSLGKKSCLIYAQLEDQSEEVTSLVKRAKKILSNDNKVCSI